MKKYKWLHNLTTLWRNQSPSTSKFSFFNKVTLILIYYSGGDSAHVLFDAEWGGKDVQRTGFFATFTTSDDHCGGDYWSESGQFSSPGFSKTGSYDPNTDCQWTLTASAGNLVILTFLDFDLEVKGESDTYFPSWWKKLFLLLIIYEYNYIINLN